MVFGLYDIVFSSVGITDLIKIFSTAFLIGLGNFVFVLITRQTLVTLAALLVYLLCLLCLICFIRASKRICIVATHYLHNRQEIVRVMIVGGAAGVALIKEMLNSDKMKYNPVCIIDDAAEKQGKAIGGVKIVGKTEDIPAMVEKYGVREIFIAIPSVGKKRIAEIVHICKEYAVPVKVSPGLYQFASGRLAFSSFREVDVKDLLGQEQVSVDLEEIKDIIRCFMTIPEAVSLVLQTGGYAKGGQIFVLDMGEPVRIYDLAYNLIEYSGFAPNVDIDIVCTGLRSGEKLYEERLMKEKGLQKTPSDLINIAKPIEFDETKFWGQLDKLFVMVSEETGEMKTIVKELVPAYTIDKREKIKEVLDKRSQEEKSYLKAE